MSDINFQKTAKKVLEIERNGLANLEQYINNDFNKACTLIFKCTGKVVIMGMGKSGHIGRKIASTLASTGTPAFFVHPGEASHGDLGMISNKDIVLAISNSGESNEILTLIPILKKQHTGLICMTKNHLSSMGKVADIHLCIQVPKEACPLGIVPTTSTTVMLVMGDAIAVSLLEARGFTVKDFALSHPGGILGRKLLLKVSDLMHTGNNIPNVRKQATLQQALIEITRKKLGMVVICDTKMQIEGIFTDGDLRRVFSMKIDLNSAKIADLMTHGGIRVNPNMLAIDALNLIQQYHISSLLVAKKDILIGVIHLHDLLHAGII
ncbi:Arabinose 5-phosphate isomerase KdsD [Candidatus Arsenophonus lipoptenae]|uniref:Arabinose 5-phosphate isomerase n=2 Tax=Morganellaceae TaxID=1903414 RepID=A0A0X8CY37_9GAMM|nr:Arabinose 5-phosphate isomerase KdsD [Candidatus Arsenophonus lipoptenae]